MTVRRSNRYQISAPVHFQWPHSADAEVLGVGDGMIRDICVYGAFIVSRECPPVGARIQLEVELPSLGEGKAGTLVGEGCVVRVDEKGGEDAGFATCVQFYPQSKQSAQLLTKLSWEPESVKSVDGSAKVKVLLLN